MSIQNVTPVDLHLFESWARRTFSDEKVSSRSKRSSIGGGRSLKAGWKTWADKLEAVCLQLNVKMNTRIISKKSKTAARVLEFNKTIVWESVLQLVVEAAVAFRTEVWSTGAVHASHSTACRPWTWQQTIQWPKKSLRKLTLFPSPCKTRPFWMLLKTAM